MPKVSESQNVDRSQLGPWQAAPASAPRPATEVPQTQAQSPFMLSSMPLQAATSDLFARQFYGGKRVPQQRILPTVQRNR